MIVNRDVTQRVEAEEKLAHNARHDALTGLPNRRLFLDRLQGCFAQAQRDPHFRYALLLLALDAFKTLNHTLGPAAGDQVLIEIGLRLQTYLRETDPLAHPHQECPGDIVLSRLGGDDFNVLLEGCTDPSDVLRVAERIQTAVAAPLILEQGPLRAAISIGIALSAAQHRKTGPTRPPQKPRLSFRPGLSLLVRPRPRSRPAVSPESTNLSHPVLFPPPVILSI